MKLLIISTLALLQIVVRSAEPDDTHLDTLWNSVTTYLSNDFFPPTTSECVWSWGEGRCVRKIEPLSECGCSNAIYKDANDIDIWYRCALQPQLGDLDLGRACRKVEVGSLGDTAKEFYDPTECPADEKIQSNERGFCSVGEFQKNEWSRAIHQIEGGLKATKKITRKLTTKAVCALEEGEGNGYSLKEKTKRALRIFTENMDVEC